MPRHLYTAFSPFGSRDQLGVVGFHPKRLISPPKILLDFVESSQMFLYKKITLAVMSQPKHQLTLPWALQSKTKNFRRGSWTNQGGCAFLSRVTLRTRIWNCELDLWGTGNTQPPRTFRASLKTSIVELVTSLVKTEVSEVSASLQTGVKWHFAFLDTGRRNSTHKIILTCPMEQNFRTNQKAGFWNKRVQRKDLPLGDPHSLLLSSDLEIEYLSFLSEQHYHIPALNSSILEVIVGKHFFSFHSRSPWKKCVGNDRGRFGTVENGLLLKLDIPAMSSLRPTCIILMEMCGTKQKKHTARVTC